MGRSASPDRGPAHRIGAKPAAACHPRRRCRLGKEPTRGDHRHAVARQEGIEIELLPLSLSARGQGRIGEITQLISAAFDFAVKEASTIEKNNEGSRGAVILLVDEADALAQSRETAEMQHEEIAGLDTFIRGIDRLAPIAACRRRSSCAPTATNWIDPAITRRAAEILTFGRPDEEQRRLLLDPELGELGFDVAAIDAIVAAPDRATAASVSPSRTLRSG